jgi:2-polyprenyl-3-methyl-5-hydroxy-6-metoxy-1,4-benzoquinol methylase
MGYTNTEAAQQSGEIIGFSFGENWKTFSVDINETVIASAVQSFKNFTHLRSLEDYDFLDIGCGSGLSSLVALRLGARRVSSIDIDPHSVECTRTLRDSQGVDQRRWEVQHGSVLEPEFMKSLGRFSYVHSWGVLHHTGAMWKALENVCRFNIEAEGLIHLALYNTTPTSGRWLKIKRLCNRSPHFLFPLMTKSYAALLLLRMLTRGRSPLRYVRGYQQARGMSLMRDLDDWFGGLPYEHATPDEVLDHLVEYGCSMLRLKTTRSNGCNEFLFRVGAGLGANL